MKKLKVSLLVSLFAFSASAQDQVGSTVKTGLNNGWVWAQAILGFAIILVTVIGIVVTYSKKNSEQPGEFKKYLTGFAIGVIFLIVALSLVTVIKTQVQNALNV